MSRDVQKGKQTKDREFSMRIIRNFNFRPLSERGDSKQNVKGRIGCLAIINITCLMYR